MSEMFDAWWHANRFELVVAAGLIVMIALGMATYFVIDRLKKK